MNNSGRRNWTEITGVIDSHKRFVVSSHHYPDGDATGSCLGLIHYLKGLGKKAKCLSSDPIQQVLQFLDRDGDCQIYQSGGFDWSWPEVIFILDTSEPKRMDEVGQDIPWDSDNCITVCIDHHRITGKLPTDVSLVDRDASSVGEMVTDLILTHSGEIPPECASPLYVAVMTDTGGFRFANTTGDAMRAAAELIDAGAPAEKLYEQIYEKNSWSRVKIFGEMIERAENICGGKIACSVLPLEVFEKHGSDPEEIEGFVEYLRTVNTVEMSILIREVDGQIKASLRSRNDVNVADFASRFGGGGHMYAAGFVSPFIDLKQTVRETLSAAEEFVNAASPVSGKK